MTLPKNDRDLVAAIGHRLADELARHPAKDVARRMGVSLPTVGRMRRGELPSSALLLRALRRFGSRFARRVLEPVIGPADAAYHLSKLDEIERTLKEIRDATRNARAHAAGPAPEGMGVPDRRDGAGLAGGVSHALVERPPGALAVPGRDLTRGPPMPLSRRAI